MCDIERNEACKTVEYLDIKSFYSRNCLFSKLVLACKDEILDKTEISFVDKKKTCEKLNCLIYTFSLTIILTIICYFLSVFISINYCY